MRWKDILLWAAGLSLLAAVQQGLFDKQVHTDAGKTLFRHTEVIHPENKQRFFEEVKKGNSAQWAYDVYTTEGDSVHYTLVFDADQRDYRITIDTRDDKYSRPSLYQITCNGYDYTADQLTGCDAPPGMFPLEGAALHP